MGSSSSRITAAARSHPQRRCREVCTIARSSNSDATVPLTSCVPSVVFTASIMFSWHACSSAIDPMDQTPPAVVAAAGREIRITNPDKVLFPTGHTKLDLAHYYIAVSDGALRAAGGRPNVLKRYPNGINDEFF